MEPTYDPISRKAEFILDKNSTVVCPHCQSGFVIIALGVKSGEVNYMAICNLAAAKIKMYCPYCGKDMTEIFRW